MHAHPRNGVLIKMRQWKRLGPDIIDNLPANLLRQVEGIVRQISEGDNVLVSVAGIMQGILLVSIFFLAVSISACGNGDSGSGGGSTSTPPATVRTVYLADQDIDGVFELYLVGSSIKLNPSLPPGKNVTHFQISPNKQAVVYRADQDTDEVYELYRVEFSNPGVSTKLNGLLPPGGDVEFEFEITPDSSSVIYLAEQTTDGVLELYKTSFTAPGVSIKLNGPLIAGGNVFFVFEIAPNNSSVVYRAIETTANTIELYRVLLSVPGSSVKLNGALPSDGDVDWLKITPDSASVVYDVAQHLPNFDFKSELYWTRFSTPGQSTKLSGPLGTVNGVVEKFISGAFDITPDNSAVVYKTQSLTGDLRFLNRVPFSTPGQSTKLNGSGGDRFVLEFAIRPDSSGVVYTTNPSGTAIRLRDTELYFVSFAPAGASTKLNGPLVTGGGLADFGGGPSVFAIAPDNSAVVYVADESTDQVVELYRVPFTTPGVSTKLNGPLVGGGGVFSFFARGPIVTPDSSGVLYLANQTSAGVTELYRVPFATPGVSSKLNGPLVTGGNVEKFQVR